MASSVKSPLPREKAVENEPNLLPDWYPRILRRRQWLRVQMVVSLLLVMALAFSLVSWKGNEEVTQWRLRNLNAHRQETALELAELQERERYLATLMRRAEVIEQIGLPVEVTRVLAELDQAASDSVALTRIHVTTDQQRGGAMNEVPPTLMLRFEVKGIALSADQAISFSQHLQRDQLFHETRLRRASHSEDGGPVEFDMSFAIELLLEDRDRRRA